MAKEEEEGGLVEKAVLPLTSFSLHLFAHQSALDHEPAAPIQDLIPQ